MQSKPIEFRKATNKRVVGCINIKYLILLKNINRNAFKVTVITTKSYRTYEIYDILLLLEWYLACKDVSDLL